MVAKTAASKPNMVYFECTRPSGDGTCSDDSCPRGYPGANIPRGTGYFYISKALVNMRRDALSLDALQKKVLKMQQIMGANMMTAISGVFMPILVCEQGAKKRGINLAIAADDAKYWWETGLAPLRPTPMVRDGNKKTLSRVTKILAAIIIFLLIVGVVFISFHFFKTQQFKEIGANFISLVISIIFL